MVFFTNALALRETGQGEMPVPIHNAQATLPFWKLLKSEHLFHLADPPYGSSVALLPVDEPDLA